MRKLSKGLNVGMLTLLGGVSQMAISSTAFAQDEAADGSDEIVIQGIRKSLEASKDIKRNSTGVVDAITAEDMGKFPDTNLAESLQRISGVSISRSLGEGSQVTVRGFGPDFNVVLLNGRQMPSAFTGGGASGARSFDFGNLASEGIAGVQVYKTGKVSVPTGGVGSTLNISTARPLDAPGLRYTVGAKAVIDNSVTSIGDEEVTPEISGLWSNTYADDRIGVTLGGSYQRRVSGLAQAGTTNGWRGAYLGSENNWGTLPQPPNDTQVTNRPGPDDVYSVPQNLNYQLAHFERERLNGQLAIQVRPIDTITATLDYFYSKNNVQAEKADMGVWFNHGNTTSSWTDGPLASPIFYSEDFGDGGTDLSFAGHKDGTESENKSLGINLEWEVTDNWTIEVDHHNSTAFTGPDSPYGSSNSLSVADFQLRTQTANFENDIPVLTLGFQSGLNDIDAARIVATGNVFQHVLMETEIDQFQIHNTYEFDDSIVSSVDFGVSHTTNNARTAFGNAQRDTWGGVGTAADLPDDIFTRVNLSENFDQFSGADLTQADFFYFDFDDLIRILDVDGFGGDPNYQALCGGDGVCRPDTFLNDQSIEEESIAGYFNINSNFDIGTMPAALSVGTRYEETDVVSPSNVSVPTGAQWVAFTEFALIGLDGSNSVEQEFTGEYEYWLPTVDFQVDPTDDIKLRASYGKTITRPNYRDIFGGLTVAQGFNAGGGNGSRGNTNLKPVLSENIDLSAEWYYSEGSYASIGYFNKKVEDFNGTAVVRESPFDVYTPLGGPRWQAAVDATGTTDAGTVRQWIFDNTDPAFLDPTGTDGLGLTTGNILGNPAEDPLVQFDITTKLNNEAANLDGWEFAVQHIFGETGFGAIANYTIVDGDVTFDNQLVPSSGDPQFALLGLSNSYNVIGFYDKDGLQARVAYNWRDEYLTSTVGVSGTANNPLYVEEYGQWDINASYEIRDGVTVFVEGINVTDETARVVGRTDAYVNFATQTGARYNIGARFNF